jgi:hypothetical protein
MATGRSPFRVADLLFLAEIFDGRGGAEDRVVVYQRRRGISSSL